MILTQERGKEGSSLGIGGRRESAGGDGVLSVGQGDASGEETATQRQKPTQISELPKFSPAGVRRKAPKNVSVDSCVNVHQPVKLPKLKMFRTM